MEFYCLKMKDRRNFNKENLKRRHGKMVSSGESSEGPRTVRMGKKELVPNEV